MAGFLIQNKPRISGGGSRGFSLVEVIIAVAIITISLVVLFQVYTTFVRVEFGNTRTVKASFLIEEGLEVVRLLRDASWSSNISPLTSGTNYYFNWTGSAWQLTLTPQTTDTLYTRKVVFAPVYRDSSDRIVSSGGTLDPGTKLFTVTVSWPQTGTSVTTSKQVSSYITDMFTN